MYAGSRPSSFLLHLWLKVAVFDSKVCTSGLWTQPRQPKEKRTCLCVNVFVFACQCVALAEPGWMGMPANASPNGSLAIRSARCARHTQLLSISQGVCRSFERHPRVLHQSTREFGIHGHVVRSGDLSPRTESRERISEGEMRAMVCYNQILRIAYGKHR